MGNGPMNTAPPLWASPSFPDRSDNFINAINIRAIPVRIRTKPLKCKYATCIHTFKTKTFVDINFHVSISSFTMLFKNALPVNFHQCIIYEN